MPDHEAPKSTGCCRARVVVESVAAACSRRAGESGLRYAGTSLPEMEGEKAVRIAISTLLAGLAVVGAGDADVAQSLSARMPQGCPQFAIVATIDVDGQRVTISQDGTRSAGNTIRLINRR